MQDAQIMRINLCIVRLMKSERRGIKRDRIYSNLIILAFFLIISVYKVYCFYHMNLWLKFYFILLQKFV